MGFPIRNESSNVLGGFNEIFLIRRSPGRFFAGTVREGCISNDDRTLGVYSRGNARYLWRSQTRRSNRGKPVPAFAEPSPAFAG